MDFDAGGVQGVYVLVYSVVESRELFGYKLRQMLCYENWIEGATQSLISHYFDPAILKICTSQSSKCSE
jgi:hypothetical protein